MVPLQRVVLGVLLAIGGCGGHPPAVPGVQETLAATPAPRPARDPQAVEQITFADLDLPLDSASDYQPWMLTQRVQDLVDRQVCISGFMGQGLFQVAKIREFILLRDTECCQFGPGATADHMIQIKLAQGVTTSLVKREIAVEGKLVILPYMGTDGKTWSVYALEGARLVEAK